MRKKCGTSLSLILWLYVFSSTAPCCVVVAKNATTLSAFNFPDSKISAHPMNMGDCLAWARKRHHILARPNDKSGMTLKPCTSVQPQHDLKTRNILDTTKSSSTSCIFIIRLLKRFVEPGCRFTGVVTCHYFQNLVLVNYTIADLTL